MADVVGRSDAAALSRTSRWAGDHPVLWVWLLVCSLFVACWAIGVSPNGDSDDVLKLQKIRWYLETGAWFDRSVPGILQPEPFISHWPRLLDLPYALLAWAIEPLAGRDAALNAAAFAAPLLLLLPALALYRTVISAPGFERLQVAFVLALLPALRAFFEFEPGRVDYHNLQILSLLASIALIYSRRGAAAAANGALVALALATSVEFALFFALTIAIYAVEFIAGEDGSGRRLGFFGAALSATALLAYPLIVAPGDYGLAACDRYSAPHLLALVFAGVSFAAAALVSAGRTHSERPPPLTPPHKGEGDNAGIVPAKIVKVWRWTTMAQSPPPPCGEGLGVGVISDGTITPVPRRTASPLVRAALIAVPAITSLALLALLYPQCLAGPYAGISAYLRDAWLLAISQERSLFARPQFVLSASMVSAAFLFAGATAPGIIAALGRPRDRHLLIFALFALLAMAQAVLYSRNLRYLPLFAGPGLLLLLASLVPRLRRAGALLAGRFSGAVQSPVALLAPGLLVSAVLLLYHLSIATPLPAAAMAKLAGSCNLHAMDSQAWPQGARIMAPPRIGIRLLPGLAGAAVIAVPFHTAAAGLERAYRFLDPKTADPRIVLDRSLATHVAICAWRGQPFADGNARYPLAVKLMEGRSPPWLVECPTDPASSIRIYRYPAAGGAGETCPVKR